MKKLSHLDLSGNPGMVDISDKKSNVRTAAAFAKVNVPRNVMNEIIIAGSLTKKGSIIHTAIIAGTMAVKKTYEVIPLCHQIPISSCKILIDEKPDGYGITCTVKTMGGTGVEMEALHGASITALTIYDMAKALSHEIEIAQVHLLMKKGGKSDYKR